MFYKQKTLFVLSIVCLLVFLFGIIECSQIYECQNIGDTMEGEFEWHYDPSEGTDCKISWSNNSVEGNYCLKIDYSFLNEKIGWFTISRNVKWDISNYEKITFWMKGDGSESNLIIRISGDDGTTVGYGPFSMRDKSWKECTAYIKIPTWNWSKDKKNPEYNQISTISIFLTRDSAKPPCSGTIYIDNIKFIKEKDNVSTDGLLYNVRSINKNGNMVIDGVPFFPIFIYTTIGVDKYSAVHITENNKIPFSEELMRSWFKEIKEAGFNMVQSYTIPLGYGGPGADFNKKIEGVKLFLDYANEYGLKVLDTVYGHISGPLVVDDSKEEEAIRNSKEQLQKRIEAIKTHPALGAYYITDEFFNSGIKKEDLEGFYYFIKKLDTVHPTLAVECTTAAFPLYREGTDIFAPDIYPCGEKYPADITSVAKTLDIVKSVQRGEPPKPYLWAVLQIHKSSRFPTESEMRAMTFLALTRDVKGLGYFAYSFPDGDPPYSRSAPDHWRNVSNVINSIHTVFPALFSDKVVKNYTIDNNKIQSIAKQVIEKGKKYIYLITVNPSDGNEQKEPISLNFTFEDISFVDNIYVLDETEKGEFKLGSIRQLQKTSNGFIDTFQENSPYI